jgi:hypothetical protein
MRNMVFVSLFGINKALFIEWLKLDDLNVLEKLINKGYIQELNRRIMLHPIICDVARSTLEPTFSNCTVFIESLCYICEKKTNLLNDKAIFQTAENIVKYTETKNNLMGKLKIAGIKRATLYDLNNFNNNIN